MDTTAFCYPKWWLPIQLEIMISTQNFTNKLNYISGEFDVVKFLVKKKADVNAKNDLKWTPLHFATQNGVTGYFVTRKEILIN